MKIDFPNLNKPMIIHYFAKVEKEVFADSVHGESISENGHNKTHWVFKLGDETTSVLEASIYKQDRKKVDYLYH